MFPEKDVFAEYEPSQLPMLEQSFLAAWAIVCPKQIVTGSPQETELRMALARCMAKLASKGFKDSD
jgi:hypothetical protein